MNEMDRARAIVRRGATVMLTLALTAGSLPTGAIAAFAEQPAAVTAVAAAETTKSVSFKLLNADDQTQESMGAKFLESSASVTLANGSYTVTITTNAANDKLGDQGLNEIIGPDGKSATKNGKSYTFTVTADQAKAGFKIGFKAGAMGTEAKYAIMKFTSDLPTAATLDKSALTAKIAEARAKQQGKKSAQAWQTLQAAITAAQNASTSATTQDQVDQAVTTLTNAITAFTNSPDEQTTVTPTESTFALYYKGSKDEGAKYARSFKSNVQAVQQSDGSYLVELTANSVSSMGGKLLDVTVGGKKVAYTDNADGSRTYKLPVKDLKGTINFTFSYSISAGNYSGTNVHPFQLVLEGGTYGGLKSFEDEQVAVAEAALEAGDYKSAAAKEALQKAIDAVKNATDETARTTAFNNLPKAISTFRAVTDPRFKEGEAYAVPLTFHKTGTSTQSMAAIYFAPAAKVVYQNGVYTVSIESTSSMVKGLAYNGTDATKSGSTYTFTFDSIDEALNVLLHAEIPGGVTHDEYADLVLDGAKAQTGAPATYAKLGAAITAAKQVTQGNKTDAAWKTFQTAITTAEGVAAKVTTDQNAVDSATSTLEKATATFKASADKGSGTTNSNNNNGGSNNNNNNGNNNGGSNTSAAKTFEVGHTYQVPIAFKKTGSSEDSMSGQYFGDTALVRPQADGTFKVSFSTNRPDWITGLTYKGAAVASNNGEYTITIPAATADTVLNIGMTVKPMGNANVTADMHLYLTRATDLGTGKDSQTASSGKTGANGTSTSKSLPKTGDDAAATIAFTAGAGVALIAGAEVLRRRSNATR